MVQKDPDTAPSLELPSLFGRRKRHEGQTVRTPAAQGSRDAGGTAVDDRTEDTAVLPTTEPTTEPPTELAPAPPPVAAPAPSAAPPAGGATAAGPAAVPGSDTPRTRSVGRRKAAGSRSLPTMAATTAALVVGGLVGLLGCLLTYLGLRGCELVTGTGSCGGPGLLVLVVILVVMVIAGTIALRALGVADAANVSFLGVGVLTVIALLFLIDYLYDPWMFLVVPVVTAVTYALARWITTMYADDLDDDDGGMPHVDIR